MKCAAWRRSAVYAFGSIVFSAAPLFAQPPTKVEFSSGRNTVTLKGVLDDANRDYVVRAKEGQRMEVTLTSADPYARFNIYRKNYDEPLGEAGEMLAKDATGWKDILGGAGDYHIYVFDPKRGRPTFTLEITLLRAGPRAEDYEGYFATSEKRVRGFPGFEGIQMTTIRFTSDGKTLPVKPKASVYVSGKPISVLNPILKGSDLSFETPVVRGVSYQFAGAFSRGTSGDPQLMVLKGRLTKYVGGKKIAEADVELAYQEGVD